MIALPRPVSLTIIFLLSVAVMAGFGQAVSRLFVRFEPLAAYRLDIVGSIAGIAVFSALSFLQLPPLAWGVIAAGGLAVLLGRDDEVVSVRGGRRRHRAARDGLLRAARAVVAVLQAVREAGTAAPTRRCT